MQFVKMKWMHGLCTIFILNYYIVNVHVKSLSWWNNSFSLTDTAIGPAYLFFCLFHFYLAISIRFFQMYILLQNLMPCITTITRSLGKKLNAFIDINRKIAVLVAIDMSHLSDLMHRCRYILAIMLHTWPLCVLTFVSRLVKLSQVCLIHVTNE